MSDHHDTPLLGRDLPPYEINEPEAPWKKVKVFKRGDFWTWEHRCPWSYEPHGGFAHMTQKIAFHYAAHHARKCL